MAQVPCWIYKSIRKDEMYLYVVAKDDFTRVPAALIAHFGTPRFVMNLLLDTDRRLARADTGEVLAQLRERGWYLQMPPLPQAHAGRSS